MRNKGHLARPGDFYIRVRARIVALTIVMTLSVIAAQVAQAQTFSVLYSFTGGADGYGPAAGLTMDANGNLYGTTEYGGSLDDGAVFQLKHGLSSWVLNSLYSFTNGNDGENPEARVIFGPDGSLYGTASSGGSGAVGTVFNLRPSPNFCRSTVCPWNISVLYSFSLLDGGGGTPVTEPVFDHLGNLFGTTILGGPDEAGIVYELSPMAGGGWNETVIHTFGGCDGAAPMGSLVFDASGNLYGTTYGGDGSCADGTVYQLTPAGSGWQETQIHRFPFPNGDQYGLGPIGGVIVDPSGTLYGTTPYGGGGEGGTIFNATLSGGSWMLGLLHDLGSGLPLAEVGPVASLAMDTMGNLYGTTRSQGAYRSGSVFKLSRSGSSWTFSTLHDFTGGADGWRPLSNLIFDSNGNLYGTTYGGGECCGVVFEITP
ncbi:MAG: choice-of-anchor tandem repeat GloVer-containing protein [Candidatus Korobacteraceae bacterium]